MKIALLIILFIGIAALFMGAKRKTNPSTSNTQSDVTAEEFVRKIDSLGYFKYARPEDVEKLKKNHIEIFNSEGTWGGIWDEETYLPLDYRYFWCDGEAVFELDGFTTMLDEMAPTFQKMGCEIHIDNHLEEWDEEKEWLNHGITINGTEYVIFKNFKGYGWGEAVHRLAVIVNTELEKQNINERVYLISGGNDGTLIFLNDDLYAYFYETFTAPQWKPLEVNEWAELMGVKEMSLE